MNGDGRPDLIVASNTGGMHCCAVYTVYSLEQPIRVLATIDGGHSDFVCFADTDNNGNYEALLNDWIFAYWKTSFAQSPAPLIILSSGQTGYKLATNLMKTSPPSKQQQEQILHDWSTSCQISAHKNTFSLDPSVWRDMLNLIYSGNSIVAFSLLDEFWTNETYATNLETDKHNSEIINTGKNKFIKLFLEQLGLSSYLAGIKQLNPSDRNIRNLQ